MQVSQLRRVLPHVASLRVVLLLHLQSFALDRLDQLGDRPGFVAGAQSPFFVAGPLKGGARRYKVRFGLLPFRLRERHRVLAHLVVHSIDELLAGFEDGVGDPDGIVGSEGAHVQDDDAGRQLDRQRDMLLPVLDDFLDGLMRLQARQPINR